MVLITSLLSFTEEHWLARSSLLMLFIVYENTLSRFRKLQVFSSYIVSLLSFFLQVSPYPVILSIENHCSPEQQIVMAQIFSDILGDILFINRCLSLFFFKNILNSLTFVSRAGYLPPPSILQKPTLPSPEDLKFKILLKVITANWQSIRFNWPILSSAQSNESWLK